MKFLSQYITNFVLALSFLSTLCHAEPPRIIPPELQKEYTMNGLIPVNYWWFDNTLQPDEFTYFNYALVEKDKAVAKNRGINYFGRTDLYLYEAIETLIGSFEGKTVGIIGSTSPWYEAIVLAYGGFPISIGFHTIVSDHPEIMTMTMEEYEMSPIKFDYLLAISSYEHFGLGRYGDPINPNGDLDAMHNARSMLKDGGLLFLAVPIGQDQLFWNAHRIYGAIRFPLLIKEWDVIESFGFEDTDFRNEDLSAAHQPIFVLKPKSEGSRL